MNRSSQYIVINGACIHSDDAKIPAITSGLYYGAGCFETLLYEDGGIFKYTDHVDRLNRSLQYLGVQATALVDKRSLLHNIRDLLNANDLSKCKSRIRIQASLTGKGGYSSTYDIESPIVLIITAEKISKIYAPKSLIISDTNVVPSKCRPSNLKLSNMLHYRDAFREAEKCGVDDAIMLTVDGYLAETTIANLFWVKNEKVYTSSTDCDILPGILRDSIIEILQDSGTYDLVEGKFNITDLTSSEFVFLTNSVIEIVPVEKVKNKIFVTDSPFFESLKKLFVSYKENHMTNV